LYTAEYAMSFLLSEVRLMDERRDYDRTHPEGQPDRDQADLLVTPADGGEHECDEREDQKDRAQVQAREPAIDELRKHPQAQTDSDQVRLLVTPPDRGDDENYEGDDQ